MQVIQELGPWDEEGRLLDADGCQAYCEDHADNVLEKHNALQGRIQNVSLSFTSRFIHASLPKDSLRDTLQLLFNLRFSSKRQFEGHAANLSKLNLHTI